MALISIIQDFHPLNNAKLLDTAEKLRPILHHRIVEPVGAFVLKDRYSPEAEEIEMHRVHHLAMGKGENLCLDFGTHLVGNVTLEFTYTGSHPDAPAYLKLKFAETYKELAENSEDYSGWISQSWIQEEYIHVDVLPAVVELPRRHAFRYLKITTMDTSVKYKLVVRNAECKTVTSADMRKLTPCTHPDPFLQKMDEISLRTLQNCMQDVFEDGPKRDQRLWMGDLRLQALANYCTFRNYDLVRRCLYLFAGSRFPDGRIAACLFTKPTVEADDTWLFDYSLFFVVALEEYMQQTNDEETLKDLYDIAMQQIEITLRYLEFDGTIEKERAANAFLDWNEEMNKSAGALAVLIYALRYARRLARRKNDWSQSSWLDEQLERLKRVARTAYYDEARKCFVSGGEASVITQTWMVLADVLHPDEARALMERSEEFFDCFPMKTPYMHHYYVSALLRVGLKEKALEHMKAYWGSMMEAGADTFWEAWDPEHPDDSPYGGAIINSYCHAWSCTPTYLIRSWFTGEKHSDDRL